MPDQLSMTDLLAHADDNYHQRRTVKPSWMETCGCGGQVLVSGDTPRPWVCAKCQEQEKGIDRWTT